MLAYSLKYGPFHFLYEPPLLRANFVFNKLPQRKKNMKVPTHSSLHKKIFQELKGTNTAIPSEIIFKLPLSPLFP